MPHTTPPMTWLCCRLGVQDAAGRDRVDDARDADDAELLVHLHLGEDRRMGVAGVRAVVVELGGFLVLDAIEAGVSHGVGDRTRRGLRPLG